MRAMSLAELVQRSQKIVHGTVSSVVVRDAPDGTIWTNYTLRGARAAKGALTQSGAFHFRSQGGASSRGSQRIAGVPRFEAGDEVLIFWSSQNRRCQIMGWSQGTLRVLVSPSGKRTLLDNAGQVMLGLTANGFVRGARPAWVELRQESGLEVVGVTADVQFAADDTSATPEDFMQELGALASSLPDLAPPDQPSEGTTEPYPPSGDERGAVPPGQGVSP